MPIKHKEYRLNSTEQNNLYSSYRHPSINKIKVYVVGMVVDGEQTEFSTFKRVEPAEKEALRLCNKYFSGTFDNLDDAIDYERSEGWFDNNDEAILVYDVTYLNV